MNFDKAYDALDVALVKYKVIIYIVIAVAALGTAAALGFGLAATLAEGKADKVAAAYQKEKAELTNLALQAEQRARSLESNQSSAMFTAASTYESVTQNEKDIIARRVADLLSDNQRLRVRLAKATAPTGGAVVPGTAAATSGGDGQTEQALAGPVAARLTQRYADYNEIVGQLELCQTVVRLDRAMFEQPKTP